MDDPYEGRALAIDFRIRLKKNKQFLIVKKLDD